MQFASRTGYSATLAVARIDRLIGRSFAIFILISLAESAYGLWNQREYLNLPVSLAVLSVYLVAQICNIVNFYFLSGGVWSFLLHGTAVLFLLWTWPLQVQDAEALPENFRPWVWWVAGGGAIAVGLLVPRLYAWVYFFVPPISWFFIALTPAGGGESIAKAIEDAAFVALFPAAIVAMAHLLRQSASRVDAATDLAAQAAANRARTDAVEIERARVDALVHDSVLTTLIVAAQAQTPADHKAAAKSAEEALAKLKRAADEEPSEQVSVLAFMRALEDSIARLAPSVIVTSSGGSAKLMSSDAVSALTDATAQAVTNSLQHAGSRAQRQVRIKANSKQVKIVISDNGVGFRPSRLPRSRLGLRLSIIQRVETVGGRVFIDSKPGSGTNIILEWDLE
jgi:signal transduction histidine kinase